MAKNTSNVSDDAKASLEDLINLDERLTVRDRAITSASVRIAIKQSRIINLKVLLGL